MVIVRIYISISYAAHSVFRVRGIAGKRGEISMKKKSLLALGLAFLMLSLLFSACGTQETPPPEQSDPALPPPSSSEALPDDNVVEPSGLRFVTSAEEFDAQTVGTEEIGRASCRERVCMFV